MILGSCHVPVIKPLGLTGAHLNPTREVNECLMVWRHKLYDEASQRDTEYRPVWLWLDSETFWDFCLDIFPRVSGSSTDYVVMKQVQWVEKLNVVQLIYCVSLDETRAQQKYKYIHMKVEFLYNLSLTSSVCIDLFQVCLWNIDHLLFIWEASRWLEVS